MLTERQFPFAFGRLAEIRNTDLLFYLSLMLVMFADLHTCAYARLLASFVTGLLSWTNYDYRDTTVEEGRRSVLCGTL